MAGTPAAEATFGPEAPAKCQRCPRLVAYRKENESKEPSWFNGAVPSFGTCRRAASDRWIGAGAKWGEPHRAPVHRRLCRGSCSTKHSKRFGFAVGEYQARADDGLKLVDCMVTNAVRCAPPENKPEPSEITSCRPFFESRLDHLPRLKVILALGRIAHEQTLAALNKRKALFPFAHGARHELGDGRVLFDSYHCSRYNTNTGRLTTAMFGSVFEAVRRELA